MKMLSIPSQINAYFHEVMLNNQSYFISINNFLDPIATRSFVLAINTRRECETIMICSAFNQSSIHGPDPGPVNQS